MANVGYLSTLTLHQIQTAPDDRVATATLAAIFGNSGATLMALAIMTSTFGCANGLILAGARVYYAMSQDGLFFRSIGKLNANHVPAMGLVLQGIWAAILVLLRTRLVNATTGAVTYGNLYGVLLDYVIFAVLIFYVLTIGGVFVLRRKRPDAERPYRAWGYPIVPILYIVTALIIMLILILYQTQDTWPGLVIVLLGVPVYWAWSRGTVSCGVDAPVGTGFSLSGFDFSVVTLRKSRQAEACPTTKVNYGQSIVPSKDARSARRGTPERESIAPRSRPHPAFEPGRRRDHRHRHLRPDRRRGA